MKCYMVKTAGCVRLAGTGGEARAFRQAMVDEREDVKKKDVEITPVELAGGKPTLLAFLNGILEAVDDNLEFEMPEELQEIDKAAKKQEREAKKAAKQTPAKDAPRQRDPKHQADKDRAAAKAPAKKAPAKKPAKKR